MIKVSLFAEQERESKLDKIGDALSKLAEDVDFAALAAETCCAAAGAWVIAREAAPHLAAAVGLEAIITRATGAMRLAIAPVDTAGEVLLGLDSSDA